MTLSVYFKEYQSENDWTDWTDYLVNAPDIVKQIEGEIEGDAGVIVYDNTQLVLRYEDDIYTQFTKELNSVKRYLIKIEFNRLDNNGDQESKKVFEGVVNFRSISKPYWYDKTAGKLIRVISFEVKDRLSALETAIVTTTQRNCIYRTMNPDDITLPDVEDAYFTDRVELTYGGFAVKWFLVHEDGHDGVYNPFTTSYGDVSCVITTGWDSGNSREQQVWHGETVFKKGEIILVGYKESSRSSYRYLLVVDSWLESTPPSNFTDNFIYGVGPTTFIRTIELNTQFVYRDRSEELGNLWNKKYGYAVSLYEVWDCNYYSESRNHIEIIASSPDSNGKYPLLSYDALKILETVLEFGWDDIVVENNLGVSTFELPLEYFSQLIWELPFEKNLLEVVKFFSSVMNAYIFFRQSDNKLVIQKWSSIKNKAVNRTVDYSKLQGQGVEKYFWQNIVDTVEVRIQSPYWVRDTNNKAILGEFIDGSGSASLGLGQTAKTSIKKDLILSKAILDSYGADINYSEESDFQISQKLNDIASLIAEDILDFYGKRRSSHDNTFVLTWSSLDWDVLDIFLINSAKHFVTRLEISSGNYSITTEFVEADGHAYELEGISFNAFPSSIFNSGGDFSGSSGGFGRIYSSSSISADEVNSIINEYLLDELFIEDGFISINQLRFITTGEDLRFYGETSGGKDRFVFYSKDGVNIGKLYFNIFDADTFKISTDLDKILLDVDVKVIGKLFLSEIDEINEHSYIEKISADSSVFVRLYTESELYSGDISFGAGASDLLINTSLSSFLFNKKVSVKDRLNISGNGGFVPFEVKREAGQEDNLFEIRDEDNNILFFVDYEGNVSGYAATFTDLIIDEVDILGVKHSFTINTSAEDVDVSLTFERTTGGQAVFTWNGSIVQLNRLFKSTGLSIAASISQDPPSNPVDGQIWIQPV